MQKLSEASDRKKGPRMRKEKGTFRQKEGKHSFSASDQRSDNTWLTSGGHHAFIFGRHVG